ncbi:uncharacterized protein LOC108148057 isoform X2 [Drosophila elegans]|uniref:uncharacterized protein LOC108148057 isoform X2 n=1 Tax=Drosophila elegans TaxID=30023 RepID=UPI0007E7100E|nr:uncharacterized protein LOC108148057 isoform X2 [Drosophila elegans]
MGGKSYYCDYCCCFMKNDLNVRKLHNDGISHTIAKTNYMRRYDDPEKILIEERAKIPCQRYFGGYCKFELFCKYSHYNEKEIQELEKLEDQLPKEKEIQSMALENSSSEGITSFSTKHELSQAQTNQF